MSGEKRAILTDIEGTTTDVAFVHDVLFPYARKALPNFVRTHAKDRTVAQALKEAREAALTPEADLDETIAALLQWIDEDRKITPLKTLQGLIWEAGYASGELKAPIYPDVRDALKRWHDAGHALYVYSSGSIAAQRLLFAHSIAGDLTPLFSGYFDTTTGSKLEAQSYAAIAAALKRTPEAVLFLSDNPNEIDAARNAGMRAVRVDRALKPEAAAIEDGVAVVGGFGSIDPENASGIRA